MNEHLNHLQKNLVRLIIFSNKYDNSEPLFKKFDILDIYTLCKFQTFLFIFDLKNNILARTDENYFKLICHSHNTRAARNLNFFLQRSNSSNQKRSVIFNGTMFWNSLPLFLKKK